MDAGITAKAAARTAGRTVATIRHWCRYGAVAAAKVSGKWVIETTSLARRVQLSAKVAPAKKATPAPAPAPRVMPATTAKLGYRKTKSGEWVAYGPASVVKVGPAAVSKRDGSTKAETITRLGKVFTVNDVDMVYGYLAATRPTTTTSRPARNTSCEECGRPGASHNHYDSSGIPGTVCGPCSRQPSYMLSFA